MGNVSRISVKNCTRHFNLRSIGKNPHGKLSLQAWVKIFNFDK